LTNLIAMNAMRHSGVGNQVRTF